MEYIVAENTKVKRDPDKIRAIQEWEIQRDVSQRKNFLELCIYYKKFAKNFSLIAKLLFVYYSFEPIITKEYSKA